MPLALLVGALAVVTFDLLPLAQRVPEDADMGIELVRSAARWLLALPIVCAVWGSLAEALAARVARRWGQGVARLAIAVALAAPLCACIAPLYGGAAIRRSVWRWPGLVLSLVGAVLGVALVQELMRVFMQRGLLARHTRLRWLVGGLWVGAALALGAVVNLHVLRGLYPSFHLAVSLACVLLCALSLAEPLQRRAYLGGSQLVVGRGARLFVLACLAWVCTGALGLSAGMGRLLLIEGAPLLGPFVVPAHVLDSALVRLAQPPRVVPVTRLWHFERMLPASEVRRSVLLITVDAMRHDALDRDSALGRCMPRLQARAAQATRYLRAYAPSNETALSVTAWLTGRTSFRDSAHWQRFELLPEAFARAGWATSAWFSAHDMAPIRADLDVPSSGGFGFEVYNKQYLGAREVLKWAASRLRGEPAFVWVHLSDVHGPMHLPLTAAPPAGCEDDYLARHAQLDAELDETLALLTARDPQLVWAIGADHGESRGERGVWGHRGNLFDEQVRVPLLVGGAGLGGKTEPGAVSLSALGSVLLALASAPTAPSLAQLEWTSPAALGAVLLLSRSECGLVRDGYKLIAAPRAGTLALYDLAADPGELRNLAGRDPSRARELLRELDGLGCPAGELRNLAPP